MSYQILIKVLVTTTTTTKLLQSYLTLCDPIDGSPPGSPVPGILQARTLEWVAISFSNAWKWKVKGSRSVVSDSSRPHGLRPTRLLRPWDFPGKSAGVGCHCLLQSISETAINFSGLLRYGHGGGRVMTARKMPGFPKIFRETALG